MTPRAQIVEAFKSPTCMSCNIKFENIERLNVHMRVKHQETDDLRLVRLTNVMQASINKGPSIQIQQIKSLDCSECGVMFVNINEFRNHYDNHHFSVQKPLDGIKKEKVDSNVNVSKINSMKELCEICDEFFNGSRNLRDHQNEKHCENRERDKFKEVVCD